MDVVAGTGLHLSLLVDGPSISIEESLLDFVELGGDGGLFAWVGRMAVDEEVERSAIRFVGWVLKESVEESLR